MKEKLEEKSGAAGREDRQEEKRKNGVRTIQTVLWVSLILVQMTVVNSLTVRAEPVPQAVQSGQEAVRSQSVEKMVTYRQAEGAAGIPETMAVTVKIGGTSYEVVCEAAERQILQEYWMEDFAFPVTFHSYDSQYFQVGEKLVPYDADRPGLEGCELQLLDMLGLSPDEYEITSVVWAGDPYRDEDGSLCRDARGSGRRLVRDYEVRYVGNLELPAETGELPEEREIAEEAELPEETETAETMQTEETTEVSVIVLPEQEESRSEDTMTKKPLTLLQIITRTMLAAVGIGAILFFGGLLVLFIRKIRQLRKKY